jgi:hypothetical protein
MVKAVINKVKTQPLEREKIFPNYISYQELISNGKKKNKY